MDTQVRIGRDMRRSADPNPLGDPVRIGQRITETWSPAILPGIVNSIRGRVDGEEADENLS